MNGNDYNMTTTPASGAKTSNIKVMYMYGPLSVSALHTDCLFIYYDYYATESTYARA